MAKSRSQFLTGIVFLFFCAACSPDYQVPSDYLRLQLGAEPSTLNPVLATDGYASNINSFIFDTLIDVDYDTLEYIPKLAEKWSISPDRKIYTFHLRKDVLWHDGEKLTADDVVYSFGVIKDPKTDAPHLKVYYQDIENIKKLDDHTVQFKYSKIYFKGFSTCGFMPILPKHIMEKQGDFEHGTFSRAPVGDGPYRFKKWETNKRIVLERNDDYWGEKPEIRTIEFKVIHDAAIGLQILKKGLLDDFGLSSIQWTKQTGSDKFNAMFSKLTYPGRTYSFIGWNLKSPYFNDKRVRKAMTMLIDRAKIKDKILFGMASEVTGTFFPLSPQSNPNIVPLRYDVKGAKALLADAGWIDGDGDGMLEKDGKKFVFTFMYSSGSTFAERLSTILKESLKRVGIEMTIVRLEWAAFLDRLDKRDFDATTLAWSLPIETDPYQLWHSSQTKIEGSSNFISYENKQVDWLIERARVEFNESARNRLYWKFQEIIYDDQPYTFLYSQPTLEAVAKRFDNVIVHSAGLNPLEWKVKP